MTPENALEFLCVGAVNFYTLSRSAEYNAARNVLTKLVQDAAAAKAIEKANVTAPVQPA